MQVIECLILSVYAYLSVAQGVLAQLVNSSDLDVNFVDAVNGRPAIMICGLDPQNYDTLDVDCAVIATMLLKRGARRAAPDYRGWTPLLFGASRGMTRYCETLLLWNSSNVTEEIMAPLGDDIDIDFPDPIGRTAVMLAAVNGRFATVKMLISHGANISIQNTHGQTALHLATSRATTNSSAKSLGEYSDFVRVAGKIKGLIDTRDQDNRTALMYAVMALHADVVEILLGQAADPTLVDKYGTSIIAMASRNKALQERISQAHMDVIARRHEGWLGDTEHIIQEYERQMAQEHTMDKQQQRLEQLGLQQVGSNRFGPPARANNDADL